MRIAIDNSVKEKVESVRLGCLIYDTEVKEKNEELWRKFEDEVFPQLISAIEEKGTLKLNVNTPSVSVPNIP